MNFEWPVHRVRSIRIKDFRGWSGECKDLDVDANVVLLTGPNGFGKTSLMDALLLALTGHDYFRSRDRGDPYLQKRREALVSKGCDRFLIKLKVIGENGDEGDLEVRGEHDQDNISRFMDGEAIETDSRDAELHARCCAFFQDRVGELFEELTQGLTLRDVLERRQPELLSFESALEDRVIKGLTNTIAELRRDVDAAEREKIGQDFGAFLDRFKDWYTRAQHYHSAWPDCPTPLISKDEDFSDFIVKLGASDKQSWSSTEDALPDRVRRHLQGVLRDEVKGAMTRARAAQSRATEMETRLADIEQTADEIQKTYSHLDEEIARFRALEPDYPDLPTVLRVLASNRDRWIAAIIHQQERDPTAFQGLRAELQKVKPDVAQRYAGLVGEWWTPRLDAKKRLQSLEVDAEKLKSQLESYTSPEMEGLQQCEADLNSLNFEAWQQAHRLMLRDYRAQSRQKRADILEGLLKQSERLTQWLKPYTAPSTELKQQLQELTNQILERFVRAGDFLIELTDPPSGTGDLDDRRAFLVETNDGRNLHMFSTGQRSQAAVALLLAQNQVIVKHRPRFLRVLLLDDMTTAYDLGNISRESITWRQLAYHPDPERRRQIFISSHHEDLTNHLLDLLVPPEGYVKENGKQETFKMIVLRFKGWSMDEGPDIEDFEVEPTRSAMNEAARDAFARDLAERL